MKEKKLPEKLADCKDAEEGERWLAEHVDDHLEVDFGKPVPEWASEMVNKKAGQLMLQDQVAELAWGTHRGSALDSLFEELGELEEVRALGEKKRQEYLAQTQAERDELEKALKDKLNE